jgi:hypothetical protein
MTKTMDEWYEERQDHKKFDEDRYMASVQGQYLIEKLGRDACKQRVWRQKGLTAEDMFEMLASADHMGTSYGALYWNE